MDIYTPRQQEYMRHYERLIDRARDRILECYTERHHIVPRCMGGKNTSENLVRLTPEEHYVAHQLLVKIYPDNHKIAYACIAMTLKSKFTEIRNNKVYGWVRNRVAVAAANRMLGNSYRKGTTMSAETKAKMSAAKRSVSKETRIKYGDASRRRITTQETRLKLSKLHKGKPKTQDHRSKISSSRKAISKDARLNWTYNKNNSTQVVCPHCNKTGQLTNMKRYHFDKCKTLNT